MAAQRQKIVQAPGADETREELGADAEESYHPIEKLAELGVNAGDIKKAREAGYFTVESLQMNHSKRLKDIKGLSEAKIDKMLEMSFKLCNVCSFKTAADIVSKRANIIHVTTGSKELDTLLQGGIETGCITEAHGEFKTGKTQLSHTLCVTSQMPIEDGGGAGKVCYIDTENTFRPERIKAIAERFNLDPADVLENIIVARAYTSEHQSQIITEAAAHFTESPFRMLIIDSLTGLWRVDYCGRGELADRQQKLNHHLAQLLKIAEEFNIAVFVTNQVTANPDGALAFAPKFKPIGGHIVAHACTIRLSLIKSRGDERICKVVDSPSHAESDARFLISDGGVADV